MNHMLSMIYQWYSTWINDISMIALERVLKTLKKLLKIEKNDDTILKFKRLIIFGSWKDVIYIKIWWNWKC